MGLLDPVPERWTPPKGKGYRSPHDRPSEEKRLEELNNFDRDEEPEDYSTSPHLNY